MLEEFEKERKRLLEEMEKIEKSKQVKNPQKAKEKKKNKRYTNKNSIKLNSLQFKKSLPSEPKNNESKVESKNAMVNENSFKDIELNIVRNDKEALFSSRKELVNPNTNNPGYKPEVDSSDLAMVSPDIEINLNKANYMLIIEGKFKY